MALVMGGESIGPVSPSSKIAALCLHQSVSSEGVLGCAVESIPRSTYGSKQELIDAGLHSPSSSDAYCKNDPETCVYSVLSGIVEY